MDGRQILRISSGCGRSTRRVFAKYLDTKLSDTYPKRPFADALDEIIEDSRWDMTYLRCKSWLKPRRSLWVHVPAE